MKLKTTLQREYVYEIEVDESIITEEFLKDWSNTFQDVETVEDFIEVLAIRLTTQAGEFMEGFGHVKTFFANGAEMLQTGDEWERIEGDAYTEGITVHIKDDGDEIYSYNTELVNQ